jgi:hypothetical protein
MMLDIADVVDDYVKKGDNAIVFPSGVNADNATYNPTYGWMWGNQFLSYYRTTTI